uniref:Uncharacterized protein n=1 Tax=Arundo donax TaxID=35708 RepID=A0A0A9CKM2_ARUDO
MPRNASTTPHDTNCSEELGKIMRILAIELTTEKTSSSVPSFIISFSKDTNKNEMLVSPESTSSAIICMSST